MAIIEVSHVSKTFQSKVRTIHALKDVSLEIEKGDIYGIIGMYGAGKSTLVRCLNYLEVPTKGHVVVGGKDLGDLSEKELLDERKSMAMIFQHFNLLMQKNVLDNICFPLLIQGTRKKEARERARELLDVVGLADKELAYPAQLSGGQKQRVAIARALASNPRILLCDEATSALDPQTSGSILKLLEQINREYGITIVLITHQMSVVRQICNKVAIMSLGEIKEKGTVEEIFSHPKTRDARELLLKDPDSGYDEDLIKESGRMEELLAERKIRIVFSTNSSFEPVIANMVLLTGLPVNILRADTRNVGGIARGEMILGLPDDEKAQEVILSYLNERGLAVEEVTGDV